jgi:hypothetical protein
VTVDFEDSDEVTDEIGDLLDDIQVERRLPIWVVPVPSTERVVAAVDAGSRPATAAASAE